MLETEISLQFSIFTRKNSKTDFASSGKCLTLSQKEKRALSLWSKKGLRGITASFFSSSFFLPLSSPLMLFFRRSCDAQKPTGKREIAKKKCVFLACSGRGKMNCARSDANDDRHKTQKLLRINCRRCYCQKFPPRFNCRVNKGGGSRGHHCYVYSRPRAIKVGETAKLFPM